MRDLKISLIFSSLISICSFMVGMFSGVAFLTLIFRSALFFVFGFIFIILLFKTLYIFIPEIEMFFNSISEDANVHSNYGKEFEYSSNGEVDKEEYKSFVEQYSKNTSEARTISDWNASTSVTVETPEENETDDTQDTDQTTESVINSSKFDDTQADQTTEGIMNKTNPDKKRKSQKAEFEYASKKTFPDENPREFANKINDDVAFTQNVDLNYNNVRNDHDPKKMLDKIKKENTQKVAKSISSVMKQK